MKIMYVFFKALAAVRTEFSNYHAMDMLVKRAGIG
jgi:hypothetical protein